MGHVGWVSQVLSESQGLSKPKEFLCFVIAHCVTKREKDQGKLLELLQLRALALHQALEVAQPQSQQQWPCSCCAALVLLLSWRWLSG